MLAVYSNRNFAVAVVFSAYTGAALQQERLPGPVSHVQAIGEDADARRHFLMADITPPFTDTVDVFVFPFRAALPAAPVHLWAADRATGALWLRLHCARELYRCIGCLPPCLSECGGAH